MCGDIFIAEIILISIINEFCVNTKFVGLLSCRSLHEVDASLDSRGKYLWIRYISAINIATHYIVCNKANFTLSSTMQRERLRAYVCKAHRYENKNMIEHD